MLNAIVSVATATAAYILGSTDTPATCSRPFANTTYCDTVSKSYMDSGCADSCFQAPGWGGKMCASVGRLSYLDPPYYGAAALLFSEDGSTFTYASVPVGTPREDLISNIFDWTTYTDVFFENYQTFKLYDNPYVSAGLPQVASEASNSSAWRGMHNTGIYFTPDFTRMYFVVGFDFLADAQSRDILAPFYPQGFFGNYTGLAWIKDLTFLLENGNVDEDTVSAPYFTCVSHSPELPPPSALATIVAAPVCDGIHTLDLDGVYTCYSTVNGGEACLLFESPSFVCLPPQQVTGQAQWWIET